MAHQVQILLPLFDNDGKAIARSHFRTVAEQLATRFGGLTAHTRAPVEGIWKPGGRATRDVLVIYEVTVDRLDRKWWQSYRRKLEKLFRQDELVIRLYKVETIQRANRSAKSR